MNASVVCSGIQAIAPWRQSMQTEAFMCGNLKLGDQSFALNMTNMAKNLLRTNQVD